MRNKFTIIISDINGSKHYTLNQIIKRVALYIMLTIALLFIIGGVYIKYLNTKVKEINQREIIYKKRNSNLLSQNEILYKKINDLSVEISKKKNELSALNDKISNLEESMGLKSDIKENILTTIDTLKINSLQKKIFLTDIPNGYPVPYNGISSKFGWRINPITKRKEYHPGLDLRAKTGEKIIATADGIVEFAGYSKRSGYGNLIIIDHNYGFKTLFGHLKKVLVKNAQFVKKGDVIGLVGSTGLSTAHHLHYGIMYLQRFLNPYYFAKWDSSNFDYIFKKVRRVKWQSLIKAIQAQIQLSSQQVPK